MLKQIWGAWKIQAQAIAEFQSRWLLTVFYFLVLTPFAQIARLSGDALRLKPASGSMWTPRPASPVDLERAHKQY